MVSKKGNDVLVGYYGFGNFGDDLFRAILEKILHEKPWGRPLVSAARPGPLDRVARNLRAAANLANSRSITLGGGSVLGFRASLTIRHVEMAVARAKRIPYCAVGVGIMEGQRTPPSDLIDAMSWVGLRSKREFIELRGDFPHVRYTSDIVYSAPRTLHLSEPSSSAQGVTIIPAGVGELGNAMSDPAFTRDWLFKCVVPLLESPARATILLLQPQNGVDRALCERMRISLAEIGIDAPVVEHVDPVDTLRCISSSSIVYTDRLHGAIAAHVTGVPFRLSKHHPKCEDLLSDIEHPDAPIGASFARDTDKRSLDAVYEWQTRQAATVDGHSRVASEALDDWSSHLETHLG